MAKNIDSNNKNNKSEAEKKIKFEDEINQDKLIYLTNNISSQY